MPRRAGICVNDLGATARRQVDAYLIAERIRDDLKAKRAGMSEEDSFQIDVVEFLALGLTDGAWFCHVPNGGKRSKAEGGKFKAMGVKAGCPDLLVVWRGRSFWIELKTRTGTLSTNQKNTHAALIGAGSPVATCRSLADIETTLRGWGIPLRASTQGISA